MNSTSSFIPSDGEPLSNAFTEITPLPSQNYCGIAKAKRYGRWWILKYMKPEYSQQLVYQSLLQKEFELMIGLQHPNIVTTVGWEHVESLGDCIVMEWIDGVNLKQWLTDKHKHSDRTRIARQLMDALSYIHSQQLAHRDLKPSNIMITRNGDNVKLIDFGLSDSDSFAVFKQKAGSPGYMDEQTNKEQSILADIYSLGCVFADLQLGMLYRPIVRKCCAPVSHRYQHVEDVQNAFRLRSRLPRISVAVMAIVMVLLLMGITIHSLNQSQVEQVITQTQQDSHRLADSIKQNRTYSASQIQAMKDEQSNTALKNKHIQDSLQMRIKELEASAEAATKAEQLKKEYISRGKEGIDKICGPLNQHLKAPTTKEDRKKLMDEIGRAEGSALEYINRYPKSLGLTESETMNIDVVLRQYITKKYIQPWSQLLNSTLQQ